MCAGGGAAAPVYWGFAVPPHLLTLYARVLQASKLLVVLDIDETLLVANTVETLHQRVRVAQATRCVGAPGPGAG
jgi:hypothetical protein